MITQINNSHSKFFVFYSRPFHLDLLRENLSNCSRPEMGLREPWLCTGQTIGMEGRGFWVKDRDTVGSMQRGAACWRGDRKPHLPEVADETSVSRRRCVEVWGFDVFYLNSLKNRPMEGLDLFCVVPVSGNGEGNGTPLQYSCLKNPMGGEAW